MTLKLICYFISRYFPQRVFSTCHRKGIECYFLSRIFHREQDCPRVRKLEGTL